MTARFIADENTSHHLVAAGRKLAPSFPLQHLADWQNGRALGLKDDPLLLTLRESGLILVSFDRRTLADEAGQLSREGVGHAGVILFRRLIPATAYGVRPRPGIGPTVSFTCRQRDRPLHHSLRRVAVARRIGIGLAINGTPGTKP